MKHLINQVLINNNRYVLIFLGENMNKNEISISNLLRHFINKLSFKTPFNSFNTCFSRLALLIEFTNWNRNVRAVPSRLPV